MTGRLTMVCCGATAATRQAAFTLDEPLEDRALAAAAPLGRQLRRADRVWTSPALRARQTARALGLVATGKPELADQDMGDWAGHSLAGLAQEEPQAIAVWLADPDAAPHGGETLAAVSARAAALLDALLAERGHTIAVTHAAVIRAAVLHVLDAPLASFWKIDVEPLSVTEFRSDGRRWVLRSSGLVAAAKPDF